MKTYPRNSLTSMLKGTDRLTSYTNQVTLSCPFLYTRLPYTPNTAYKNSPIKNPIQVSDRQLEPIINILFHKHMTQSVLITKELPLDIILYDPARSLDLLQFHWHTKSPLLPFNRHIQPQGMYSYYGPHYRPKVLSSGIKILWQRDFRESSNNPKSQKT